MNKNNIEISTLSVELRVIQINNKQMTLSVFKQLPEFSCGYPSEANIWGYVKYKIGRNGASKWLVFSMDGVLYRSDMYGMVQTGTLEKLKQIFIAV